MAKLKDHSENVIEDEIESEDGEIHDKSVKQQFKDLMNGPNRLELGEHLGVFRRRIIARMKKKGVREEDAIKMVGQIGDGHLLQLLIQYGPDILKIVMAIMALFGM